MTRDSSNNRPIIADTPRPFATPWVWAVFGALLAAGAAAASYYAWRDLTLSHYDARGHLVVARRIVDSLTPGWRQIGAVWLPLPHLANAPFVWFDWNYRTGASGVAISIGALASGLTALAGFLYARTGSRAAALVAPILILSNPNVLYLQSTPMTEPLLFGLSLLALVEMDRWLLRPSPGTRRRAGWALALLVLTRYEGWCVAAALLGVAFLANVRRPRAVLELARYPAVAVAAFLLLSWGSTGRWFVTSGFFVPDNPALGRPFRAIGDVIWSLAALGGYALVATATAGALVLLATARRQPSRLLPLALVAAGALPAFAFYEGHPYRVRYMVPLVVAAGVLAAPAIARLPRPARGWAAALLVAIVWIERPPLDATAPMILEAQWEAPFRREREAVSRHLAGAYDGGPILASMGSLGHYMHEASAIDLDLARFIHEGNGDLWAEAVRHPRRHAAWVLVEERAEGGDVLAARARADAGYLAGFARVADGGGLALYQRTPPDK